MTYISDKSALLSLPDNEHPVPVTEAQFLTFQAHFAGCKLTGVQEECQQYMDNRQQWLAEDEADKSSLPYCEAGIYDSPNGTEFWYSTTSGTLLVVLFSAAGVDYSIHIPTSREGGHHQRQLGYILAGADDETISAGLNLYEEDENYKVWESWYSKQRYTLPNWRRINSYATEMRQRQVNKLLQNIHSRAEAYVKEGGEIAFDMLLEGFEEAALAHPSQGLYKKYEEEVIFAVGEGF